MAKFKEQILNAFIKGMTATNAPTVFVQTADLKAVIDAEDLEDVVVRTVGAKENGPTGEEEAGLSEVRRELLLEYLGVSTTPPESERPELVEVPNMLSDSEMQKRKAERRAKKKKALEEAAQKTDAVNSALQNAATNSGQVTQVNPPATS